MLVAHSSRILSSSRSAIQRIILPHHQVLSHSQYLPTKWQKARNMASVKDNIPHVVRTAEDRRETGSHNAIISRVELVNRNIRVLRLSLPDGPLRHLPGQYIDLSIPNIPQVGGFTITSPPQTALTPSTPISANKTSPNQTEQEPPYIELAIQRSPQNPPAAYLYEPPPKILSTEVQIRIGGNFTYPPSTLSFLQFQKINNVVFIAGGVGINPIMSMLSAMDIFGVGRLGGMVGRVRVLYSCRREVGGEKVEEGGGDGKEEILFEKRLLRIAERWNGNKNKNKEVDFGYTLFETGGDNAGAANEESNGGDDNNKIRHLYRRMNKDDLMDAVGDEAGRSQTLVYVCGLPTMTDVFVDLLRKTPGLDESRVLCEKWW